MNRRGRSAVQVVIVLVVIVSATALLLSSRGGNDGARSGDLRIDPQGYRPVIEQIEGILYREGAADLSDGNRVAGLIQQLGSRVLTHPNRVVATMHGQRVMSLGARIGGSVDVGYTTLDLPWARREWVAVRDSVFTDAAWFAGS